MQVTELSAEGLKHQFKIVVPSSELTSKIDERLAEMAKTAALPGFRPGRAPFKLPENAPVLYYLQRLRDEAHRWAIGAHRQKRAAEAARSPLDEIEGIGPTRKKALLHHFGSARGVSRAKVADLMQVEGVNEALAIRIHGHFNGG